MSEYRQVPIADIKVPDLRVTSQLDPHIMEELIASIKAEGVKQPIQVGECDGKLYLLDGLHRLFAATVAGIQEIPAMVRPVTEIEVYVQNLTLNRQRGKSNPTEEARIVRHLRENEGKTTPDIAALLSMSEGRVRELLNISTLPPEVLGMVASGSLGVGAASSLVALEDPAQQTQVARDSVAWHYTVEQTRQRVQELMTPDRQAAPGEFAFGAQGEPRRVPLNCALCQKELEGKDYIWCCPSCQELVRLFWRQYIGLEQAQETPAPPAQKSKILVMTERGWEPSP